MKYPRSYHRLVFIESLRSLIVIGGENNNSCEMYDFYLNTWIDFPELNFPRANSNFIVNKLGTQAFAIFGI